MATYNVIMTWNNQRVLEGKASAVITWYNLRHLMVDNFTGTTRAYGEDHCPTLVDLASAPVGQRFADGVKDDTGAATFIIERII